MRNAVLFPRLGLSLLALLLWQVAAWSQTVTLQPQLAEGDILSIDFRLEAEGHVIVLDSQGQSAQYPIDVQARLKYGERITTLQPQLQSLRHYRAARAEIRISQGSTINELDDENRYLVVRHDPSPSAIHGVQLLAPSQTLTQQQLELVHTPANTLIIHQWLQADDVRVGSKWQPQNGLLADVLSLDALQQNDVWFELHQLDGNTASVHVSGRATGRIDDASTEIDIQGNFHFDLQAGRVTAFRMGLRQRREPGPIGPGLEATIRLEMLTNNQSYDDVLDSASIAQLRLDEFEPTDLLRLESATGEFSLLHPRRWRLIRNGQDRAVFRLVESGRSLAQCDIISMEQRDAQATVDQDEFVQSVRQGLSDYDARVVRTMQSPPLSRLQWYRVEASGVSQRVPLYWIYYLVLHPDGRRVQLAITMEGEWIESFGEADRDLLDTLEFVEASADTQPLAPPLPLEHSAQNADSRPDR